MSITGMSRFPIAQMISIDDGGHLFLIEQPEEFNETVIGFLAGLSK
jgi:pimeloyl-ACP methyl ester carboxylesterase